MHLFSSLFPYLIFLAILMGLLGFYARYRFTRFEGNLKRGLMIWTGPLSWEARQFLDGLPPSTQFEQSFIRKEYNEVLIVEKRFFMKSFFGRQDYLPYVIYVNLSAPESRIECRTSLSAVVWLTINIIIFFVLLTLLFLPPFLAFGFGSWALPLIFFLVFSIGLFIWEFYQARRRLLKFLERMMSQQKSA